MQTVHYDTDTQVLNVPASTSPTMILVHKSVTEVKFLKSNKTHM